MSGLPMLLPRLITSPRHTSPRCAGIRPLAAALLLMDTAALPELVHAQTVSPSSATVSVGGSVTFTMTGLPAGMTNAGWEVGPISNWSSTATTCTIYQAGNSPGANQGCVFCYYTGPHYTGTLEYVWFYVTIPNVASPPTGTISATSTNIHVGQSTTISVSSTIDTADGDSLGYQMIACSTNVPGSSGGAPFSKNYVVFEGTSPNATYIFTPTAPGTYYFYNDVETSNFSWTSLASCTITVTQTPTTFSISPTSFTYTGSAQAPTITPTPSGATYSVTSGTASATTIGNYSFTVTANGNYSGSSTTNWSITQATPTITWPTAAAITYGTALSSTQLNATASVPGTFTYSPGAGTMLNVGSQTLSVTFTPTDSTDYTSATATMTFTVNAEPTTFSASPLSFTYNGSYWQPTITTTPSGASYSWTSGTHTAYNAGNYSFTITAYGNYSGSNTFNWSITAEPVTFSGSPTSFTYNGSAQGPTIASSPSGATFSVTSGTASATTAGNYSVTVTANGNYSGTNTFSWSISQVGQTTVSISPTSPSVTAGGSITFTASGGSGSGAYTWGGTSGATGTGATNSVSFPNVGTYTVTVYRAADSNYSTSNTATATITVNTIASTFAASPLSFTYNGAAQGPTITPTPSGATYSVTSGTASATAVGNYSATVTANGNYSGTNTFSWTINQASQSTVSITSASSMNYGNSYTATASGGNGTGAYVWALGTGSTASGPAINPSTAVITANSTGTVVITVYKAADTNYTQSATTANFTVTVNPRPITVTLAGSKPYDGTTTSTGASASITSGTLAGTDTIGYAFAANSGPAPGSYTGLTTATIFNTSAPTTRTGSYVITYAGSYTINQANQSAVSISPTTQSVTAGGSITFTASGGTGTGAYTWGGTSGATSNVIFFPNVGTYTVTVYRAGDTNYTASNTATATITVNAIAATFSASPLSFIYNGAAQGPTITPAPANATHSIMSGTATATNGGNYSFTVAANGNYSGSATFNWSISQLSQPAPTIGLSPSGTTVPLGSTTTFTASGGLGTGAYVWGGAASGTSNPTTVTFSTPGAYTVTVYNAGDTNYQQSATSSISLTSVWTLTVVAGTGGTVTGAGTFSNASPEPITASPASNYAFTGWTPTTAVTNSEAAETTVPPANVTVTANFTAVSGTASGPISFGSANASGIAGITATTTTRYAQVVNTGDHPLYVTTITATGDFTPSTTVSSSSPLTVPANSSTNVPVVFAPTGIVPSTRTGVLTLWTSDSQQSIIQFNLQGAAMGDTAPTVSATLLTQGAIDAGNTVSISVTGSSVSGTLTTIGLEILTPGGAWIGPNYFIPGGESSSLSNTFNATLTGGVGTYTVYAYAGDAAGLNSGWVLEFTIAAQSSSFQGIIESQSYPAPGYEIWFTPSPVATGTYTVQPSP